MKKPIGGEEGGPVVSLNQGYNPVAGDKKEILNAPMNVTKFVNTFFFFFLIQII